MESLSQLVIGQVLRISGYGFALVLISVVLNVINQLFFYNKNEPPVVFHWFPVLGSTIAYGMDPYQFFLSCQQKVCAHPNPMVDTYEQRGQALMVMPAR
jgi:sterol 14-demethylase